MWTSEHSIETTVETTASPEAIWRLWYDLATWPESNEEKIEISGPLAVGSTIAMTPIGQATVELRIAGASEPHLFIDEAEFPDVVVRTVHRIDPVSGDRRKVIYRMEISGPAADTVGPELGPQISSDFPETLSGLVERAER